MIQINPSILNKEPTNYTFIIFNIILSQVLALLAVGNGLASYYLFIIRYEIQKKFKTPVLIVFCYYAILFIVFIFTFRNLKKPKFCYLLITIFDSQGNFLNIWAFQLLQFSYPFIINFSSVIWTFILTFLFVKMYQYKFIHFIGTLISFIGMALALYGYMICDNTNFENRITGILLCIASSLLYSLSSIVQEIYFKSGTDIYDFYPWFGLIGLIITAVEAYLLGEYNIFTSNQNNIDTNIILLIIAASVTLFIFICIVPFFIQRLSASMFNISQVSQIFWSYIISTTLFSEDKIVKFFKLRLMKQIFI